MKKLLLILLVWGCNTSASVPHLIVTEFTGVVISIDDETHWINNSRTTFAPLNNTGYVTVTTDYKERIGFFGDTLKVQLSYKHSDIEGEPCSLSKYWVLTHPDAYNDKYGSVNWQVLELRRKQ